jgi:glycosyltransferase involved in cell wall biosynthesis
MREIALKDEPPLVSIVVPVYNGEKFLAATLQSLIGQKLTSIEIIVVNDGSTDGTENLVKHFFFDRRIRYVKKENGGTGSALNVGHQMARGKYVTWCSADNIYFPDFAKVLSDVLGNMEQQNLPVYFAYSDFIYIDEHGRHCGTVQHKGVQPKHDLVNGYDIGMSFMYTRELWNKAGPYWDKICEDYEWAVRAAQHTELCLVGVPLAAFRAHSNQLTAVKQDKIKEANVEIKKLAAKLFANQVVKTIQDGFSAELVEA